jgi:hypothetical protein
MQGPGQPIRFIIWFALLSVSWSSEAAANGSDFRPPGAAVFGDPVLRRAAIAAERNEYARAERILEPRIRRIRGDLARGFHGTDSQRRRDTLDASMLSEPPLVVVSGDRFWLRADILRLAATIHARQSHWEPAAGYLLALLRSGQASTADIVFATAVLQHLPNHPLAAQMPTPP